MEIVEDKVDDAVLAIPPVAFETACHHTASTGSLGLVRRQKCDARTRPYRVKASQAEPLIAVASRIIKFIPGRITHLPTRTVGSPLPGNIPLRSTIPLFASDPWCQGEFILGRNHPGFAEAFGAGDHMSLRYLCLPPRGVPSS
jgi:hypothetical protein